MGLDPNGKFFHRPSRHNHVYTRICLPAEKSNHPRLKIMYKASTIPTDIITEPKKLPAFKLAKPTTKHAIIVGMITKIVIMSLS